MEGEKEKPISTEDEIIGFIFTWRQRDDSIETKTVEVVLGPSGGVNNDMFEIYTEGTSVNESSPLTVHHLTRDDQSDPVQFKQELQLLKTTYQFLFRVEDHEGKISFCVSDDYQQTRLISGRAVNYIELEKNLTSIEQGITLPKNFNLLQKNSCTLVSKPSFLFTHILYMHISIF